MLEVVDSVFEIGFVMLEEIEAVDCALDVLASVEALYSSLVGSRP